MNPSVTRITGFVASLFASAAFAGPPLFTGIGVVSDNQKTSAVCQITNHSQANDLNVTVIMADLDGKPIVPPAQLVIHPLQSDISSVTYTPGTGEVRHPRCVFAFAPPTTSTTPTTLPGLPPRQALSAGLQILGNNGELVSFYYPAMP